MFFRNRNTSTSTDDALPGHAESVAIDNRHFVNGHPIAPPFPEHLQQAVFALGCFWGAERRFWTMDGVYSTAVGYCAGSTPNPTYHEVCTGRTGHAEAVLVVFDPQRVTYESLLRAFWESHDPTQGMRQGNDIGSQYRSGIYTVNASQEQAARASLDHYQSALEHRHGGAITTEIKPLDKFFHAEDYHQQYLAKNPGGYCGLGGTGVAYPAEA